MISPAAAGRIAVFAVVTCCLPATARAAGDETVCDGLSTAITLDTLEVSRREIAASGTWHGAAGSPGVVIEVREDGDPWASYTMLGASGSWSWSGLQPIGSRMCGRHTFHVYAHPLVGAGPNVYVHCLKKASDAQRPLVIDCSPSVAIEACSWNCAPAPAGEPGICEGTCTGSAQGIADAFIPHWSLDGVELEPTADAVAATGPWKQDFHCTAGQEIAFAVHAGSAKRSAAATVTCGEQPARR